MKSLLATVLLTAAVQANADGKVTCVSNQKAPVYFQNQGQWVLRFTALLKDGAIQQVSLRTKVNEDLGFGSVNLKRTTFKSNDKRLQDNYDMYNQADGWCSYRIFLPKGLNQIEDNFSGIIKSSCDEGDGGQFTVSCRK